MPTAAEIIERVKARYAGCRTYEDDVTIERTTVHGPRPWQPRVHRTRWHTMFLRPHLLRLEITELEPRPSRFAGGTIIWNVRCVFEQARGDNAKVGGSRPQTEGLECEARERSPLGSVLLPLLQLSDGAESRILIRSPTSVEPADLGGRAMHVLIASPENSIRRVFVDPDTSLIVRVEDRDIRSVRDRVPEIERLQRELADRRLRKAERTTIENTITDLDLVLDGAGSETLITFSPRMDHDIDPKVFEFVPPG